MDDKANGYEYHFTLQINCSKEQLPSDLKKHIIEGLLDSVGALPSVEVTDIRVFLT